MSVARLNAGMMATIIFLITAVVCIGLSMLIITFLGFYWDVMSILGSGLRAGSFLEALLYLLGALLTTASLFLAYHFSRKTHRWVMRHEAALEASASDDGK